MRNELTNRLTTMLMNKYGVQKDVCTDIIIILNDYEVTQRETAIALRNEDKNRDYISRFLIAKTVKGLTARTLDQYRTEITKSIDKIGKSVDDITTDDIRLYLAVRERRDKISKTTVANELRYLRTFFQYLTVEELIPHDPTKKIDAIKQPKIKKKAFSEMEVEKIRNGCKSKREKMIVEVLLSTGCRVEELVKMKTGEIEGDSVIVHGKGQKDRKVFLNAKAVLAIEEYMNCRKDENEYLLPKMFNCTTAEGKYRRGNPAELWQKKELVQLEGHTSTSSIEATVRKLGRRVGVDNVHPHRFRRTCATMALNRGMAIEQVSRMLGHEQLDTTKIYLDLDDCSLEVAHKKFVV